MLNKADIEKIRKDFPMLQGKMMQNNPLVYLDNGATTLKPQCVIDAVVNYYTNYCANAHRGDYDLSYYVDTEYEATRKSIAKFLNAETKEIVYTSGASASLNMVAYGYGNKYIQQGDVILTSEAEHASCVLPWMRIADQKGASLQYVKMEEDGRITMDAIAQALHDRVKVVVLAHISNVLGYQLPMKEICAYAHQYGAIVIVDGAQSVPHIPVDVKDMDCDFLAFSAHKMCGPTGIGILYGKFELLEQMDAIFLGGDSNARYDKNGDVLLKQPPYKFESGTQPIEAMFGFHAALMYIQQLGLRHTHAYERELHAYAIGKLKNMDHIQLYNPDNDAAIITFNVKKVFAQDAATFFNANGIAVRSGQHCAKLLNEKLKTSATIRASFYFYTSYEDVDQFLEVCAKATMEACLDVFF